MHRWLISFTILLAFSVKADVGKILEIEGRDGQIVRDGKIQFLRTAKESINAKDQILTRTSKILFHLSPSLQVSLAPGSLVNVEEYSSQKVQKKLQTQVLLKLMKGSGRFRVPGKKDDVELRLETEAVTFTIRGAEFELSLEDPASVELDVIQGQVEASSPYVQSFVPEIVKAQEGLSFDLKKKVFVKRKFTSRLKALLKFSDNQKEKGKR